MKNADNRIFCIFNLYFIVGNNHMNVCTKYNVFIMNITLVRYGGGGAPGAPPHGYLTPSNRPVEIGLRGFSYHMFLVRLESSICTCQL